MSPYIIYYRRDNSTNSQTNISTKYVSNTYGGDMQNKIYCNQIMINIYLEYALEYLIEKGCQIDNYNY